MRPALCALLLLASCATPANQPAQPGAEAQVWRGTLRCGILPTLTTLPLVQPIEVSVQDGQASYRRFVRIADTDRETSVPEHGGGPVALDGAVLLRGTATGRGYTYSASYEGSLPRAGGGTVLTGVQHWSGASFNPIDRPCTITLQR